MKKFYIGKTPRKKCETSETANEQELHLALNINSNYLNDYKNTSWSAYSSRVTNNKTYAHPYLGLIKSIQDNDYNTKLYIILHLEAHAEFKRKFNT